MREWKVLIQQLVLSDVILINKTDLIDSVAEIRAEITAINRWQKCLSANTAGLKIWTKFWIWRRTELLTARSLKQSFYTNLMASLKIETALQEHSEVKSLRLMTRKRVNRDRFERWLFELLWSNPHEKEDQIKILRAKGLLLCDDGKEIVVQAVQELYEITELSALSVVGNEESVLILLGWFGSEDIEDSIRQSFYSSI